MPRKLPSRIARIQLPALPGSPGSASLECSASLNQAGMWAVKEALQLKAAGFDGILVENWGDFPHPESNVSAITSASLAVIMTAVRESVRMPLGIRVFRDDFAALAVAAISQADFLWAQNLSGDAAAALMRERARLQAESVLIFADAGKFKNLQDLKWSGADAICYQGKETLPPSLVRSAGLAIYLDSEIPVKLSKPLSFAPAGFTCGEILRKSGEPGNPLDPKRISKTLEALKPIKKRKHGKTRRASS